MVFIIMADAAIANRETQSDSVLGGLDVAAHSGRIGVRL